MERLDVGESFDVHEHRHGLKLLEQDGKTMHLMNRRDYACPACDEPFEHLLVSEKRHNTFGTPSGPFCLTRTDDQLLLLTH